MDPSQLALQNKAALEATKAFVVEPDGRVRMSADRGGGYAPPWVWAGAIPQASGNDPQSQALRVKLSTPASDPSSPWHSMYSEGGPFTKHSAWDTSEGTYEGGIDWGTLLGTAAVGGLFAAPAIGAAFAPSTATTAGASTGAGTGATAATTATAGSRMGISKILDLALKGSDLFSNVSDVLGGASKSANQQNNTSDQLKLALANQRTNRLATALKAPGTRLSTALQAALTKAPMERAQLHWGGPGSGLRGEVPTWTGGAFDSLKAARENPTVSKLSDQILQDELLGQMNGGPSGGNQDLDMGSASDVGEESTGDKVLGGASLTTSLLGALKKSGVFDRPKTAQKTPTAQGNPDDETLGLS